MTKKRSGNSASSPDKPKRRPVRRKATQTSRFGSPGRVSHDSTPFYESRMYAGLAPQGAEAAAENPIPEERLDRIYPTSSEEMAELPDGSVHLMITSPPYNARKEYDQDLSLDEYRDLLRRVFRETYRVLVSGGRACVNVANLGRKPYIPLHAYVIADMLDLGYLMRGEIIWDKGGSAGRSTAWGSWRSAANPVLRDVHEYILVSRVLARCSDGHAATPAVSARQVGHPAPFPEELPRRLMELYSFRGDIVLDPFCGSGTTCLAAMRADRRYIGYEVEPSYVRLAEKRLAGAAGKGK
jgi:site-specific DNA-methyltransferase (adenine-specific)